MKIIVAKDAGYCFGVRDAVKMAYETAEKHGAVYMLGDIVQNEKVVEDLNKAGATVINDIDKIPKDKPILFRAHGTDATIVDKIKKQKRKIIDATCPLVYEIHEEVIKIEKSGKKVIIIGDHGHDEVIGIASQVNKPIIIANKEEAINMRKIKSAGIVSQSTQSIENVQNIINILMTKVYDLHFINTICYPTKRNQEQIQELAKKCDIMIIIGSFTSANSKRLTMLSQKINNNSYQVTCKDDIKTSWFKNNKTVGISAGASTPDYLINEVKEKIKGLNEK